MTVIDSSDSDWWKGKCLGRIGYFPSKYCARLSAGEKPVQVIQNLQIEGTGDQPEDRVMILLRDQIVVQVCLKVITVEICTIIKINVHNYNIINHCFRLAMKCQEQLW